MFSGLAQVSEGSNRVRGCLPGVCRILRDRQTRRSYLPIPPGPQELRRRNKLVPESLPDFDFLIAGFPCQAFSIAGKRQGFDDARGTLFFEIARVLSHKRPSHFLLENVGGLRSHDGGKTIQRILGILSDLGYFVEVPLLNSKDYGVPQNRERVFFIGHLGERM
jgi:DNA (cytosine-5)-methyltransferase 1